MLSVSTMHHTKNEEDDIGLSPIIDSLPPNHDKKTVYEELEEVEVVTSHDEQDQEGGGAALTKTQSRTSVLASKARVVGLVLTLTGASFLNVSTTPLYPFHCPYLMITHTVYN